MAFLHRLNTLGLGSFRAPMRCPRRLWGRLLRDLRSRGLGVRESGAFLLGTHVGCIRRVRDYMLYDDVDPDSLVGMIDLDGSRMDLVFRSSPTCTLIRSDTVRARSTRRTR